MLIVHRQYGVLPEYSKEEWLSVLHVAHNWGFRTLHQLAAAKLLPIISTVDQIVYGQEYGLNHWLIEAYVDLCTRPDWLSLEEGDKLSRSDIVRIGIVRERLKVDVDNSRDLAGKVVEKVFQAYSLQETMPHRMDVRAAALSEGSRIPVYVTRARHVFQEDHACLMRDGNEDLNYELAITRPWGFAYTEELQEELKRLRRRSAPSRYRHQQDTSGLITMDADVGHALLDEPRDIQWSDAYGAELM